MPPLASVVDLELSRLWLNMNEIGVHLLYITQQTFLLLIPKQHCSLFVDCMAIHFPIIDLDSNNRIPKSEYRIYGSMIYR